MNRKGFTLIELMLAMTFVSALLLAVAMTVIQISHIYTRGLTVKEVNQAGRSLAIELKRGVSQSAPFAVPGAKYVNQAWGGRLCVGQYSYVWNYGTTLNNATTDKNNSNVYTDGKTKMSFIKVPDSAGAYCSTLGSLIDNTNAVEMLASGDNNLAMQSFSITNNSTDPASGEAIYSISYIIGTNDQAALNPSYTSCKAPDQSGSDLNYCSINQFYIVVRALNALQ
jgi:prepilin-type N-terminal cleavage/methylation domain-containing protein